MPNFSSLWVTFFFYSASQSLFLFTVRALSPFPHNFHLYLLLTDLPLHLSKQTFVMASKQTFVMASPMFDEPFNILTIDENNNPVEVVPHHESRATYLASAICLGVAALRTPVGSAFLQSYAERFLPQSSNSWRKNMSGKQVEDLWWKKHLHNGSLYIEDWTIKHKDLMGFHHRTEWGTDGRDFDPQLQAIHLNGPASEK